MAKLQDLTGKHFGNLLVLGQSEPYVSPSGQKTTRWKVRCELCGTEKIMLRNVLIYATSCGCQRADAARAQGEARKNKKICPVCGKEFYAPPSSKKITCSKECASKRKSDTNTGKTFRWSDAARQRYSQSPAHIQQAKGQAAEAAKASMALPESQKGSQHRDAKVWIVKSPDNTIIKIVNITQWARENYQLFEPYTTDIDATVKRIKAGFSAMASSMAGYRNDTGHKVGQYKGWQLLSVLKKDAEEQAAALAEYEQKGKK